MCEHLGKGEAVLVVEDDTQVRDILVLMLTNLGYEIVEAGDARAALKVLDEMPGISLLFTDVVLPNGMGAGEFTFQAKQRRPDLKVLYTTGYSDESISVLSQIDEDIELLRKPYKKSTLARKVREALNSDD